MKKLKLENASSLLLDCIQSTTHSFVDFNSNVVDTMTEQSYREVKDIIKFNDTKHTIKLLDEAL